MKYIEKSVLAIFEIKHDELYSKSRKNAISQARSLFCYWAVKYLGHSMTEIAQQLGVSQVAVGYAVDSGEQIANDRKIKLLS